MSRPAFILIAALLVLQAGDAFAGLAGSRHDLTRDNEASYTQDSGAVCTFCHIPRGGAQKTPVWMKGMKTKPIEQYPLYAWVPAREIEKLPRPGASSLVCLSCHDGAIARNMDYRSEGKYEGKSTGGAGSAYDPLAGHEPPAYLSGDHPSGITYDPPGAGLAGITAARKKGVRLFGAQEDQVECASCHNPHTTDHPSLLYKPLNQLCAACHAGRADGRHLMAGFGFADDHPVSGKPDPLRKGKDLSCATCHAPHGSDVIVPAKQAPANFCERCHEK